MNKLQWNLTQNSTMHLKMSSIMCRPLCPGLNVLKELPLPLLPANQMPCLKIFEHVFQHRNILATQPPWMMGVVSAVCPAGQFANLSSCMSENPNSRRIYHGQSTPNSIWKLYILVYILIVGRPRVNQFNFWTYSYRHFIQDVSSNACYPIQNNMVMCHLIL